MQATNNQARTPGRKATVSEGQPGRVRLARVVCGVAFAALVALLPLPALADDQAGQTAPASSTQTATSNPTVNSQPLDQVTQPVASSIDTASSASTPAGSLAATIDSNSPTAPGSTDVTATAVKVDTTVKSDATSGSATVTGNSSAGGATTGNTESKATVVNVANANGLTASNFQTFNCDIREDIQSNIVIDPTNLMPYCSNQAASAATGTPGDGQTLQSGASLVDILNKIVLTATSGDATVANNGTAGSASTGDAAALANIVNIANSAISAKNSFVGVINIYSNVTGDILVPESLLGNLTGATSGTQGTADTTNMQTAISNAVKANAASGDALVDGNGQAGNASSGDATTSLTVMNLTGQEVIAKNSLLVFVNVLGKWIGMIVPAPGSNTALMGSGIQTSGATTEMGSNGQATTKITNDITVNATSGDATVSGNGQAGNATTGKAQAGANLLNITNSSFKLDDWFGALFINVLGSWLGNFDIQKLVAASDGNPPVQDVQVYQFAAPAKVAPVTARPAISPTTQPAAPAANIATTSTPTGTVLSASTSDRQQDSPQGAGGIKLDVLALAAIVAAITLLLALATTGIRHYFAG